MRVRRTLLYIPGNSPSMMINSPVLGADCVVFDIEDAVSTDDKDAARILIRNALKWVHRDKIEYCVRINDITTPYWQKDLKATVVSRPDALAVPKVECAEDLEMVSDYVLELEKEYNLPPYSIKFHPIIETALGIENTFSIGKSCKERIETLTLGGEDYVTSISALRSDGGGEMLYARQRIVNAAHALGLQPIDTVHSNIDNIDALISDTKFSRQIGFAGRIIVSPRHINIANGIYSPSEKDILYAQEVLDTLEAAKAAGKGAVSLYGKMLDGPMITRAEHVLAFAKLIEGGQ